MYKLGKVKITTYLIIYFITVNIYTIFFIQIFYNMYKLKIKKNVVDTYLK